MCPWVWCREAIREAGFQLQHPQSSRSLSQLLPPSSPAPPGTRPAHRHGQGPQPYPHSRFSQPQPMSPSAAAMVARPHTSSALTAAAQVRSTLEPSSTGQSWTDIRSQSGSNASSSPTPARALSQQAGPAPNTRPWPDQRSKSLAFPRPWPGPVSSRPLPSYARTSGQPGRFAAVAAEVAEHLEELQDVSREAAARESPANLAPEVDLRCLWPC